MSGSLSLGIRTLSTSIDTHRYSQAPMGERSIEAIHEPQTLLHPFAALFKAALFITARKLAGYRGGSNPTWIKTLVYKPEYCFQDIIAAWIEITHSMLNDLKSALIPQLDRVIHFPLLMDSRELQRHCIAKG